jgi:hypothetical protein
MTTKRQKLSEFSPEVFESDKIGRLLESKKQAAYENYRNIAAPTIEDHAARIAKLAKDETVEPFVDTASLKRDAANVCHDMKEACDLHYKHARVVRYKALTAFCKTFLPEHKAILTEMALGLVQAHNANVKYQELKNYLIGEGGCIGICLTDTEKVLDDPKDRSSDLAQLLRELVTLGVLSTMPASLK